MPGFNDFATALGGEVKGVIEKSVTDGRYNRWVCYDCGDCGHWGLSRDRAEYHFYLHRRRWHSDPVEDENVGF